MKPILLIILALTTLRVTAQRDSINTPICGFGLLLHQQHRQQHSLLTNQLRQTDALFQEHLARQKSARAAQEIVYTVPIVVHVIHNGEAIGTLNNPSDASIQAMVAQLNAAFRKNGASYGGVDIGIQFQLATRSPQCGTATSINRVNGSSIPNYTSGGIAVNAYSGSANEIDVKNLSRWPNTDYVNIWVVNKINGSANAGGFAWLPEYNSALVDGITMCASTVSGSNKTIVHEMGHVFNLQHTFHDYDNGNETTCPPSTSCATTGDQVCDTEPVLNVPCNTTLNSCTGAPFQLADASRNYTVLNNFMGYTNCQWMFTQGQKDRMRAALLAFRPGLISSGSLSAPADSPVAVCSVSSANGLSLYYGVGRVTLNTLDVYSNSSNADGAFYIDRTCNQRTTLIAGQSYTLTIRGTFGNRHYIRAYLDYNADGDFNDTGETLLATPSSVSAITATVIIPTASITLDTPLRLRIVADSPEGGVAPTACALAGEATHGAGQVEDYTVVVQPRSITSIASGSWTTPTTWSCSCIPGATDIVSIQPSHTVSISSGMKQALLLNLLGKLQYIAGGQLQLVGN